MACRSLTTRTMAAPDGFSSELATQESFEMNTRKLQAPSPKLQGNIKFQTPKPAFGLLTFFKLGFWSFSGAWSLVLGVSCLVSLCASAAQPSVSVSGLPLFF